MNRIPALVLILFLLGVGTTGAQPLQVIESPGRAISHVKPCTFITLRNKGVAAVEVKAQLLGQIPRLSIPATLERSTNVECAESTSTSAPAATSSVPPGEPVVMRVNFDPETLRSVGNDAKGQLLWTVGDEVIAVPVALKNPPNLNAVSAQLFWPLLPAVLLVLFVFAWSNVAWSKDMDAVEWSGERSWAGNLALLASLVTALGGFVTIGEADKPRLAILGVVFSLLSLLAPLLYRMTLHTFVDANGKEYQRGPVYGYLLASIITLWSALGGLLAVYQLLKSFQDNLVGTQAPWLSGFVLWLCVLIAAVVIAYTCRRLGQNLIETAPNKSTGVVPPKPAMPRTRSLL